MPRPPFVNDHIYHVFNRGVDKRDVFLDDEDYGRFIHDLFEFNDEAPALNVKYHFAINTMRDELRDLLVDVMLFTLMPNHFHLLIRQRSDGGIVKFMRKLGTGYTNYFNRKNDREGGLFQGRFKAVLISSDEQFQYIPQYIHLNPLKLNYGSSTSINWRSKIKFLEEYKWSSFPDYIGKQNFPSVTHREFLLKIFGGEKSYRRHVTNCLKAAGRGGWIKRISDVALD